MSDRASRGDHLIMQQARTAAALFALAHEVRLCLVGMLARSGSVGMTAGQMSVRLGVAPALMSFHLRQLLHAGLLTQRRSGRYIIYTVDKVALDSVISQLGERCLYHRTPSGSVHADVQL